ncbi:hypothetical protein JCM8097_000816 [Rhodosporidiobolus ruineniae]
MPPSRSSRSSPSSISRLLSSSHPSTAPFLRALLLGTLAQTAPSLLRTLLSLLRRRPSNRLSPLAALALLFRALRPALNPRGLGVAFGVAIGGARYLEDWVEPLVRRAYERVQQAREGRRKGKAKETSESLAEEQQRAVRDEEAVRGLVTFLAGSLSSLAALLILQSAPTSGLKTRTAKADDALDFVVTPYAPALPVQAGAEKAPREVRAEKTAGKQSATLDLTLFVFVRAADTLVRLFHDRLVPSSPCSPSSLRGRFAPLLSFLSKHGDTLLFQLSAWRIMWCWFYRPALLPPTYSAWILQLARMDPRLLQLLRFAREGRYVYGQEPDEEVRRMCEGIAAHAGRDASLVNPAHISRLSCSFVHGPLGAGSCEINALKRWARAFLDCLLIYLPVHAIPPLLFSLRKVMKQPGASVLRILLAASRSSAFLATFVASIYASVCLVRTRLPLFSHRLPRPLHLPQQPLDSGLCVALGTSLCGLSVLIENPRRRREMALYCAPRALYAVLPEIGGRKGEVLGKAVERAVFALSGGTVLSAVVNRPEAVSGVVRGIAGFAVGKDWRGGKTTL